MGRYKSIKMSSKGYKQVSIIKAYLEDKHDVDSISRVRILDYCINNFIKRLKQEEQNSREAA